MSKETRRYMRMLVFFDLPMVTVAEKRAYSKFHRFLLNDGYNMLQFSIYGRVVFGRDAEQKHLQRLQSNLPSYGSIRLLTITEKQFTGMQFLLGKPHFQEKKVNAQQFLLF